MNSLSVPTSAFRVTALSTSLVVSLVDRGVIFAEHGLPQLWRDKVKCVEADAGGDGSLDEVHADALVAAAEETLAAQHLQQRGCD